MNSEFPMNEQIFSTLLQAAGEEPEDFSVVTCKGGGNNRVFIIHANGKRLIAKWYFTHPSDIRDRLRAEYVFLEYAHDLGLSCVPKPLACLPDERMALYEYIDGGKYQPGGVTRHHIGEAVDFFLSLNGPERFRMKGFLPDASEACFSITSQISIIRNRIARLLDITPATPVDEAAMQFVERLRRTFESKAADIVRMAEHLNIDVDADLADELRCISPSDFGFHNALLRPSGKVCFLDFEYAGWDDPAKMACDFFCQPAVPVGKNHFNDFLKQVMEFSNDPSSLIARAQLLLPVFGTKWCCIMLNEFLPESAQRRRFADPDIDPDDRKNVQLRKAKRFFETITF
jgi:hypothetical protein